jgi:hypothetical protein
VGVVAAGVSDVDVAVCAEGVDGEVAKRSHDSGRAAGSLVVPWRITGVQRSLRPFPVHRMWGPWPSTSQPDDLADTQSGLDGGVCSCRRLPRSIQLVPVSVDQALDRSCGQLHRAGDLLVVVALPLQVGGLLLAGCRELMRLPQGFLVPVRRRRMSVQSAVRAR